LLRLYKHPELGETNVIIINSLKKHLIHLLLFFACIVAVYGQPAEGSLVKGSKDPVYLIENGKACWISGENIFNLLGFDWKNVKTIPDAELNKIPAGWLMVRGMGSAIYIINYGVASKVADWNTLLSLGFEKTNIRTVREEKLIKIPQQPLLVKGSGAPVYIINNGKAGWIQGEKIFKAFGYDMKTVIKVKDESLNKFPKTQLLIRGSDQKIFLVDKEKRYWISTAELFGRLGYDWNAVLTVTDSQLKRIAEGAPIK
jgi:hypothetical protein